MWFSLAIFSADCPIERPVVYSAMAGATGASSAGRNPARALAFNAGVFALDSFTSRRANSREKRIGTSERHSDPPATTMSARPRAIFSAESVMARLDEAHAMMTEEAGVFWERFASKTTSRAMLGRETEGITVP